MAVANHPRSRSHGSPWLGLSQALGVAALVAAAGALALLIGTHGSVLIGWSLFIAACLVITTRPAGPSVNLGLFGYVTMLTQVPFWIGIEAVVVGSVLANVVLQRGLLKTAVNTAVHVSGFAVMTTVYGLMEGNLGSVWPSLASAVALAVGALAFEITTTVLYWRVTGMTWGYWLRTEHLMITQTLLAVLAAVTVTTWPWTFVVLLLGIVMPPLVGRTRTV